jgi:acyl carrier protein
MPMKDDANAPRRVVGVAPLLPGGSVMDDAQLLPLVTASIRAVSESAAGVPIAPESHLFEEVGLDSLDLVSLLMRLQDELGVEFDLDAVESLRRVEDVMRLASERRARAA